MTPNADYKIEVNNNKIDWKVNNQFNSSYVSLSQSKIEFNKKDEEEYEFIKK